MTQATRTWLHGLIAGFIGGGSSAVVSGVTVTAISPQNFNFSGQLVPTLELMGILFVFNGLLSAFAYLKQSPLPPEPPQQP